MYPVIYMMMLVLFRMHVIIALHIDIVRNHRKSAINTTNGYSNNNPQND